MGISELSCAGNEISMQHPVAGGRSDHAERHGKHAHKGSRMRVAAMSIYC
jgi:hypothetical protein